MRALNVAVSTFTFCIESFTLEIQTAKCKMFNVKVKFYNSLCLRDFVAKFFESFFIISRY